MTNIKLLDCTLRDGGYVNDWQWGYERAKSIIKYLINLKFILVSLQY